MRCTWLASEVGNSKILLRVKKLGGGHEPHYPQDETTPRYQRIAVTDPLAGHISVHRDSTVNPSEF